MGKTACVKQEFSYVFEVYQAPLGLWGHGTLEANLVQNRFKNLDAAPVSRSKFATVLRNKMIIALGLAHRIKVGDANLYPAESQVFIDEVLIFQPGNQSVLHNSFNSSPKKNHLLAMQYRKPAGDFSERKICPLLCLLSSLIPLGLLGFVSVHRSSVNLHFGS